MNSHSIIPNSYLEYLQSELDDQNFIDQILQSCRTPLRKSIRVNTQRISVEKFHLVATQLGWQLEPIPWCDSGFWLTQADSQSQLSVFGHLPEHLTGLFYIQEASSMLPVQALLDAVSNFENTMILDMAAAPGSKTTQIAATMAGDGLLVANEYSASRTKALTANLARCGISNAAVSHHNAEVFGEWLPEHFDYVLLDAPCSGEGAIRKDPDAMKNWSLEHVHQTAELQFRLLESAVHALKIGGTLVYSTCTLNKFENSMVCNRLLSQFNEQLSIEPLDNLFSGAKAATTKEGYLQVWPQLFDCEGFFVAKFTKTSTTSEAKAKKRKVKASFVKASSALQKDVIDYLNNQFSITLPASVELFQRDSEIWLLPVGYPPLTEKFRFQRAGTKIAERHKRGFRLSHDFASTFGYLANARTLSFTREQVQQLYTGQDINDAKFASLQGEYIALFENSSVTIGKIINGKFKNRLPKGVITNRL